MPSSSIPAYISAIASLANNQETVDTGAGGIYTIDSTPSTGYIGATFLGVQAGNVTSPAVFSNVRLIFPPISFLKEQARTLGADNTTVHRNPKPVFWISDHHVSSMGERSRHPISDWEGEIRDARRAGGRGEYAEHVRDLRQPHHRTRVRNLPCVSQPRVPTHPQERHDRRCEQRGG